MLEDVHQLQNNILKTNRYSILIRVRHAVNYVFSILKHSMNDIVFHNR